MTNKQTDENATTRKKAAKARSSRNLSERLRVLGHSEFKRQTFYALENIRKGNLPAKIIGTLLFLLIVANAIVVCVTVQIDTVPSLDGPLDLFFKASTVCFLAEYIARVWIADLAFGGCTRFQARLKYIFSFMGIIDLLSFAPSVLSWFVPVTPALIHAVGVLRLIRLVKVTRYMRGFRTIGRVISKHYHEIVAAFLVILLLTVVSSVAMFEVEHAAQPQKFTDLFQGLWWAVETVTGTGYGDIVPITPIGKFLGTLVMLFSVGLIAIPGGIFSAGFVAEFQNADLRKIERDVRRSAKADAEESKHINSSPEGFDGPVGESVNMSDETLVDGEDQGR